MTANLQQLYAFRNQYSGSNSFEVQSQLSLVNQQIAKYEMNSLFGSNNGLLALPGAYSFNNAEMMSDSQLQSKSMQSNQLALQAMGQNQQVLGKQFHNEDNKYTKELYYRKNSRMLGNDNFSAQLFANDIVYANDLKFGITLLDQKIQSVNRNSLMARVFYPEQAAQLDTMKQTLLTEKNNLITQYQISKNQHNHTAKLFAEKPNQDEINSVSPAIDVANRSKAEIQNQSDNSIDFQIRQLENKSDNDLSATPEETAENYSKLRELKYEQNVRKYTEEFGGNEEEAIKMANVEQDLGDKKFDYLQSNQKMLTLTFEAQTAVEYAPELAVQYQTESTKINDEKAKLETEIKYLKAQKEQVLEKNTVKPQLDINQFLSQSMQLMTNGDFQGLSDLIVAFMNRNEPSENTDDYWDQILTPESTEDNNDSKYDFITDLYKDVFDRDKDDIDEPGLNYWKNEFDNGMSIEDIGKSFETVKVENQIKDLYKDIFDRGPEDIDEAGFNYWMEDYKNGMSIEDIKKSFETIKAQSEAPQVPSSPPAPPAPPPKNDKYDFITDLYKEVFDRGPDDIDEAGLNYWKNDFDNGMSKEDIRKSFETIKANQ